MAVAYCKNLLIFVERTHPVPNLPIKEDTSMSFFLKVRAHSCWRLQEATCTLK